MSECDDLRAAVFLRGTLDAAGAAHVAGCAGCREETEALRLASRALAAGGAPAPPPALARSVLRAAEPLLAANARRTARRALARAVAAALLPLPAILLLDAWVVRTAHSLLSAVLPAAVSFYMVFNYTVLLAFLLALTYGAVPILAARQLGSRSEEYHA